MDVTQEQIVNKSQRTMRRLAQAAVLTWGDLARFTVEEAERIPGIKANEWAWMRSELRRRGLWFRPVGWRPGFSNCVYFVEGAGLIKIGITNDLPFRLKSLRHQSPVPLTLLGRIGCYNGDTTMSLERSIHERFAHDRAHGEWFLDSPELRAFIESVIEPSESVQ